MMKLHINGMNTNFLFTRSRQLYLFRYSYSAYGNNKRTKNVFPMITKGDEWGPLEPSASLHALNLV